MPRDSPAVARFRPSPGRSVLAGFTMATVVGTLLLLLPIAKNGPGGASVIEAFFTTVSAVCVTGLIIVDTPSYWSGFGQAIILVLIQIGGLGVMTLASVVGVTVLRRLSLRSKLTAGAEAKSLGVVDVRALVVGVVKISFITEAIIAILLGVRFAQGYGYSPAEAAWLGVFHSVSSFNNAGFALFTDSVIPFAADPFICLPMCAAIILGGLGFPVIMQLRKHLTNPLAWSMNTRLVLWATVLLLVLGSAFITAMEWNNPRTLGPLDWPAKLLAGFFQSVQTRTAGFNSIDVSAMDSATWVGMDILMFIGGGPAGTAGGIKVTTFAVLFFIVLTEIRGEGAVNIFGKRLSRAVHRQAISVVVLAVAVVVGATVVLMIITDFSLDRILFEVISAFGTVGMSTGITADIPVVGQILLTVLMFAGRLGPVTFAAALALRERRLLYELPKERPIIG